MKYINVILFAILLSSCGSEPTGTEATGNADSLDSVQQIEDEMSKEIIEGSFDALNR